MGWFWIYPLIICYIAIEHGPLSSLIHPRTIPKASPFEKTNRWTVKRPPRVPVISREKHAAFSKVESWLSLGSISRFYVVFYCILLLVGYIWSLLSLDQSRIFIHLYHLCIHRNPIPFYLNQTHRHGSRGLFSLILTLLNMLIFQH